MPEMCYWPVPRCLDRGRWLRTQSRFQQQIFQSSFPGFFGVGFKVLTNATFVAHVSLPQALKAAGWGSLLSIALPQYWQGLKHEECGISPIPELVPRFAAGLTQTFFFYTSQLSTKTIQHVLFTGLTRDLQKAKGVPTTISGSRKELIEIRGSSALYACTQGACATLTGSTQEKLPNNCTGVHAHLQWNGYVQSLKKEQNDPANKVDFYFE